MRFLKSFDDHISNFNKEIRRHHFVFLVILCKTDNRKEYNIGNNSVNLSREKKAELNLNHGEHIPHNSKVGYHIT